MQKTSSNGHKVMLPPNASRAKKAGTILALAGAIAVTAIHAPVAAQSVTGSVSIFALGAYPNSICDSTTSGTQQASCVLIGSYVPALADPTEYDSAASAQAIANFGVLHSNSSTAGSCLYPASGVDCHTERVASAVASATFNDTLFITNAPSIGILKIGLSVTGAVLADCGSTPNCGDLADAYIQISGTSGGSVYNPEVQIALTDKSTPELSLKYNWTGFSGSIAIPISISLLTYAYCGTSANADDSCTAYAKYLNTAVVKKIQVFDANGKSVSSALVTSASATDYNNIVLITVPSVVGNSESAANNTIVEAGFVVAGENTQSSIKVPAGDVISQAPAAGIKLPAGSAVDLVISSGPAVPNVVGLTRAAASKAITKAGLVVGVVTRTSSATVPANNVISEDPLAGSSVALGSSVDLVVSKGP